MVTFCAQVEHRVGWHDSTTKRDLIDRSKEQRLGLRLTLCEDRGYQAVLVAYRGGEGDLLQFLTLLPSYSMGSPC
jgi:hypothetical protein